MVAMMDYIQLAIAVIMAATLVTTVFQLSILARQLQEQRKSSVEQISLLSNEVELLKKEMEYEYDWHRRSKALEYSLSRNRNLQELRTSIDCLFGNIHHRQRSIPYQEIADKLKQDDTSYTVITSLLAHWENLALAIHFGIVDEDVAYEMTAGIVIDHVRAFEDFITERRRTNNPRAYNYLLNLSSRWRARLYPPQPPVNTFPTPSP